MLLDSLHVPHVKYSSASSDITPQVGYFHSEILPLD